MKAIVNRSREFVLAVDRYCASLPGDPVFQISGDQLRKASVSVYSYTDAAQSETSYQKFQARMAIVREKVEEALFWLQRVETLHEDQHEQAAPDLIAQSTALKQSLADAWKHAPQSTT